MNSSKLVAFPFGYVQDRFKVPFSLHFHGKVNVRIKHQQAKQLRATRINRPILKLMKEKGQEFIFEFILEGVEASEHAPRLCPRVVLSHCADSSESTCTMLSAWNGHFQSLRLFLVEDYCHFFHRAL